MTSVNVPPLGARYWVELILASAFGASTGDLAARNLRFGHALGLIPLAVVFAAILSAEPRARVSTEAFSWFASVALWRPRPTPVALRTA